MLFVLFYVIFILPKCAIPVNTIQNRNDFSLYNYQNKELICVANGEFSDSALTWIYMADHLDISGETRK